MTTASDPTPISVHVTHNGIEYPGEVVRVAEWEPSLGDALTGDAHFRVVFVEAASSVLPRWLHDHRIAVHLPGERSRDLRRTEMDLQVMRAAVGAYSTDAELFDVFNAEDRELENRAVDAWVDSLKRGSLIAAPSLEVDLEAIFSGGFWSTWAERIGSLLLQRAHVDPPFNPALFKVPIRPEIDAPIIFDALTLGEGDSARFAIEAFGKGLGLAPGASLETVDLSGHPVVQRLTAMTAEGWPPDAMGRALAHDQGLTYPLATLFLLLWLRRGHHTARLLPGHGLLLRNGQRLTGDTLTGGEVSNLRWPSRLWERIESLMPADAASTVEPYLAALAGRSGRNESPTAAAERRLAVLRDDLAAVARTLRHLAAAQGTHDPLAELDQLHEIAEAPDVEDAARTARRLEADPAAFAAVMELWDEWSEAFLHANDLTQTIEELKAAEFGRDSRLQAERDALQERLRSPRLLRLPREWGALAEKIDRLLKDQTSA